MVTVVKTRKALIDSIVRKASDKSILPHIVLHLDGKILYMNDAAKDIFVNFIPYSSMTIHKWVDAEETVNIWLQYFNQTVEECLVKTWITQLGDGLVQEFTWFKIVFSPVVNRNKRIEYVSISFANVDAEIKGRLKLAEQVDWLRDVLSQLKTRVLVSVLCAVIGGTSWLLIQPFVDRTLIPWVYRYFGY